MKRVRTDRLRRCLAAVLVLCALASGAKLTREVRQVEAVRSRDAGIRRIIEELPEGKGKEEGNSAFQSLKEANPDLRAVLEFDSGLIRLPVVQSKEPEYYLRRDFYGNYSPEGTPFFDSNTRMGDTNMVIYGHHVYYDEDAQFSPLARLTNQKLYEENNRFSLIFEDEVREYVITHVYILTLKEYQDYDYRQPVFASEQDWEEWIALPDMKNLIDPVDRPEYGDRIVTLQTCRAWQEDTRIIVLAKEINIPGSLHFEPGFCNLYERNSL